MSESEEEVNGSENFDEKLDELRHAFERAVSLNNTLESKASTLLGFSALLISIIIFTLSSILSAPLNQSIYNIPVEYFFYFLTVAIIVVILRGMAYLRELIKLRIYTYPFYTEPNESGKRKEFCTPTWNECIVLHLNPLPFFFFKL